MTPSALNYHHLLYFWAVAKEGSLRRASEVLHVSQPSISAQLKQLEESLGAPLFTRTTRRLILTDTGQTVLEYAEEIFSLGGELLTAVRQEPGERPLRLHVGVADSVPKIDRSWSPRSRIHSGLLRGVRLIERSSRLQTIGIAKGLRMEVFAITAQRRLQHPGVVAMTAKPE